MGTTKLTENSPTKSLIKAWADVSDYAEHAMRPIRRELKRRGRTIVKRVNTPDKTPALYIFFTHKHGGTSMAGLLVSGSEGTGVVSSAGDVRQSADEMRDIFILRSHAVNRYMERHGWEGTFEQCQEYLFANLVISPQNIDKYTGEAIVYFGGGVFLGTYKDNRCSLNTWVRNTQLYTNQRLISKRLQDNIEKLFKQI